MAYHETESPDVFLTDFQQLKAQGKLSEDEFAKVKKSAIHATAETLKSVSPIIASTKFSGDESKEAYEAADEQHLEGAEGAVSNVTPNSAPPITLAEALARKNAAANNSGVD